ncbi:flagellar protein FliT [Corticimicrobacter populi]|uniref:Flagellar protein FliT n=1 Tax=Corticimicrobacter populi TaxID=2175229 RepID=A0A2V1JY35_9BURK|nr:flagellar protein FliT [Corticimicrobacter populi]PWF21217.1 hypothetical protein DD235_15475 [Corticimicrobacter populi]
MAQAPTALLSRYEELHSLVKAMLLAAQRDNWEFFMDLGPRYITLAEELTSASAIPTETADRERCAELLEQVLQLDTEIRELADQQLVQIRQQIAQTRREQKLNRTYGRHPQPA